MVPVGRGYAIRPGASARYRLEGTVAEIRYDALAFTGAETRALLECHGVEASEPATRTGRPDRGLGGRHSPGGNRLAAKVARLTRMRSRRASGRSLAGSRVSGRRGPPRDANTRREFLLSTSVVGEISPGLANELTGRRDSERMLIDLSRNTFVQPVPGSPGRYRTHSLFRAFLGAQLALEAPADVADLHRRAAGWFAASGRVAEAVDHAVAAGDWVSAAKLVIGRMVIGTLLVPTPTGTEMAQSLSRIPADVDSAEISVVRAAGARPP